jgi:hypothetical protein
LVNVLTFAFAFASVFTFVSVFASVLYIYPMRPIVLILLLLPSWMHAQVSTDSASAFIKNIYREAYTELKAYQWLTTLTKEVGHRLTGSPEAAKAVEWSKSVLDTLGLDSVWLQEVQVPHWVRGDNESVILI